MKIMGVDPSLACTGISLSNGTTLAVKPHSRGDDRLMELADHLHTLAVANQIDLVVIEGLGGVYKGEAAKVVPMLHGALRLELKRLPVPYMVLLPSTLKKFATGNGSADKTLMAMAAYKRLGREYRTSDECDADWLRVAGRFAYGLEEPLENGRVLHLPQDQLKALTWSASKREPIVWPVVSGREPWPETPMQGPMVQHAPGVAVLCDACASQDRAVCG
jgi:Holliday junction resolvasome RuvABC endonuclease subunit